MGLSGVVAFLFVIEPSAHLTDQAGPGVMQCQSGLSPSTRAASFDHLVGEREQPRGAPRCQALAPFEG
jgi:hypothetical protein